MKKLLANLALAPIAVLALAGCTPSLNNSMTVEVLASLKEEKGSDIRVTSYEYDDQGRISGEKQTLNGSTVYETTEYTYGESIERFRTTQNEGGSTSKHRLETTFKYENNLLTEVFKVFLISGDEADETNPVNVYESSTSNDNERRPMGYKHTNKAGETVLQRSGYDYSGLQTSFIYTYVESGDGLTPQRMTLEYTSASLREYKLYANEVSTPQTEKGELVEERTGYSSDDTTLSFNIIDHSGESPVTTKYTYTYKQITLDR
jgi:YD repeat-containing protein